MHTLLYSKMIFNIFHIRSTDLKYIIIFCFIKPTWKDLKNVVFVHNAGIITSSYTEIAFLTHRLFDVLGNPHWENEGNNAEDANNWKTKPHDKLKTNHPYRIIACYFQQVPLVCCTLSAQNNHRSGTGPTVSNVLEL